MSDSSYSYSLTTFSPSGQLMQIEYALAAVAKGNNSVGIRGIISIILFFQSCKWCSISRRKSCTITIN